MFVMRRTTWPWALEGSPKRQILQSSLMTPDLEGVFGYSCCISSGSDPRAQMITSAEFPNSEISAKKNPPSRFVFCFETT